MLRVLAALVLVLALASPSLAVEGLQATTLENGLRVLLLEDHRSPVASFQVWYRVGSRNEHRGATGIAHFLEHMMFKGTPQHGVGQFARLVEQNGGQNNAFTSQDTTAYFENIASSRLPLVVDLEADRMRNLLLDPKQIDSERQVILEERRMRTDDDPSGFLGEQVNALSFNEHPYGQPIIGWAVDVDRITPAQIRAFYRTYYAPNNAIVVAVGDFKAEDLLEKIRATFGAIPRGPDAAPVQIVEPPQAGDRRVLVRKPAELPIVYIAYHVPNHQSEDAAPLEVLSTILSSGRASRLYRHLVYQRQLALDASGDYSYFSVDPNLFWYSATPMPGQTPETLEKALLDEVERVKKEPVTAEELQRAKNQIEASFVFRQDSVFRRASQLARFELIGGASLTDQFLEKIRAVTAADVTRVAQRWFPQDRKNVGVLLPPAR